MEYCSITNRNVQSRSDAKTSTKRITAKLTRLWSFALSDKLKFSKLKISKQFSELRLMDLSNIRIKEHFGIVTNDTNTTQFNFLISPPKNRESIEKQDIVCLDHPTYGDAC